MNVITLMIATSIQHEREALTLCRYCFSSSTSAPRKNRFGRQKSNGDPQRPIVPFFILSEELRAQLLALHARHELGDLFDFRLPVGGAKILPAGGHGDTPQGVLVQAAQNELVVLIALVFGHLTPLVENRNGIAARSSYAHGMDQDARISGRFRPPPSCRPRAAPRRSAKSRL